MSAIHPFLTEGLHLRRVGVVTQATAILTRTPDTHSSTGEPAKRLLSITFPTQIPMGGGWRLQHQSPASGQLVTTNSLVEVFRNTLYSDSICLHTFNVYNTRLLDSIASVFDHLQVDDHRSEGYYGYDFIMPQPVSAAGGTPNLLYYKPIEAPSEQYLLLYDNRFAPGDRPDEEPSFVNLYALVRVEFDEEQFVDLLRQALAAADRAN